jgi:bifunctional polynucleotide phosphatase/kinase
MNPESRQILPQLAFNSFASRYQEPKEDEGFSEIVPIDFRFNGTEEDKKVWRQYWN